MMLIRLPRILKRFMLFAALLLCVCLSSACKNKVEEPVFTPAPTLAPSPSPTPEPEIVHFGLPEATETPLNELPTPTPTLLPGETPIPFSYYAPTVNMTFEELVGGTADFGEFGSKNVDWPEGYPDPATYRVIIDVYWQVVMIYRQDEKGKYTVPVRYMLCSTGTSAYADEGGGETRRGDYKMEVPRVRFGQFLSGESAQYWTLIRGRTYFHSILYSEQNNLSSYMEESYTALGSKASHGCIRLTVPDARWIWYNISYDTVCIIRDGSKKDQQTAAIRQQLVLPQAPVKRVKLKAGQTPYTDNWSIRDVSCDVPFKNELPPPPDVS